VEAQHVKDAHGRCGRAEQLRMLGETRTDQQASVGAAVDRDAIGARPATVTAEPARDGAEVVEDVLLVGQPAGVVPRLAVLPAAAQVRDREHTTALGPHRPQSREGWRDRDVEPAIAV